MSGFWSQRLAPAQSQPAPAPAPAYNPNAPWWNQRAAAPVVAPPTPTQQPVPGYGSGIPQTQGEAAFGDLIRQEEYTTDKAKSSLQSEPCPDCGGPNYMTPQGNDKVAKRCFDCGYNPMFTQSMAGVSGSGQNIPVKTARVQQANTNNFNPQGIFAHIG